MGGVGGLENQPQVLGGGCVEPCRTRRAESRLHAQTEAQVQKFCPLTLARASATCGPAGAWTGPDPDGSLRRKAHGRGGLGQ